VLSSQRQRPRRQLFGRQPVEMSLNWRAKIVCLANVQRLVAELNETTVVIWADDELDFLAPIQDYRSLLPSGWTGRILVAFLDLFEDPVEVPFGKCAGLFDGTDSGHCCSDGAVRLHANNVVPCSAIAGELDGDRLGTDS
jgi:hypothetical protein